MAIDAQGSRGMREMLLCNIPKLHRTVFSGMAKHSKTGKSRGRRGTPRNAALKNRKETV